MPMKTFPLTLEQTEALTEDFPTPFHLYDEAAIRANPSATNDPLIIAVFGLAGA